MVTQRRRGAHVGVSRLGVTTSQARTVAEALEILVDTEVQVPAADAPKKVVDALRRQLRQHDLPRLLRHDGSQRALLNLLQTHQGHHRLPQGLLNRVTQTLSRHGVPFAVVDRRAMVSCPAIRSRLTLGDEQQEALRRLLAGDSGVLVAGELDDRQAVAVELIARRQQRTLILVAPRREADARQLAGGWIEAIDRGLSLGRSQLGVVDNPELLGDQNEDLRVVVASCATAARAGSLGRAFGMVIFDGLHAVDPVTLMRAVRATDARYVLGLSAEARRSDSLGEPLFLALGGVVHQLRAHVPRSPRLSYRPERTSFSYPYEGRSQYQALIATLAADRARNGQIAADVAREARAGQACLVLSERRDQLEALAELLPAELAVDRVSSAVGPSERKQVVDRFERGELSVLLATSQIALDLVRAPRVSRVFLAFPFSYARRLERLVALLRLPSADKALVALYDYDDLDVTPLHRAFEKRAKLLERLRRDAERDYLRWAQLDLLSR